MSGVIYEERIMPKLTIAQALKNIDIVVASVKMNRAEHVALAESITVVKEACTTGKKKKR